MEAIANKKVGDIVAGNFRSAKVFTDYGIDFCCKGGIKLSEVCQARGLNIEEVVEKVQTAIKNTDDTNYQSMGMSKLVNHIVQVHHKYVEDTIPAVKSYLDKIEKVHGLNHPELKQIKELFFGAADALTSHMKKEEFILFPYVKAMEESKLKQFKLSPPHFGSIDNPIAMMEHEHDTEGERFRQIAALSNNYTPPSDACQTYIVAFSMLKEFENDLHTHIHLENNILFPLAKEIYQELNN